MWQVLLTFAIGVTVFGSYMYYRFENSISFDYTGVSDEKEAAEALAGEPWSRDDVSLARAAEAFPRRGNAQRVNTHQPSACYLLCLRPHDRNLIPAGQTDLHDSVDLLKQ